MNQSLVKATIIDDRIHVRAHFSRKDECKSVSGARWSKKTSTWTYPATVDTCINLRRVFGEYLRVQTVLAEWYEEAAQRAAEQTALASATDATLALVPRVAPRLAATLRPDQRVGARFIAEGYHGSVLVADKPGLGKTLETIAGIIEMGIDGDVLIVCPKLSVRNVWWREITRWTDEPVYMARGTRAQREKALAAFEADKSPRKWVVIVSEMLRIKETLDPEDPNGKRMKFAGYEYPGLFSKTWAAVAVDESQRLFGSLTVTKGNLMGKGIKRLPVIRRIAVSGTPFGKGGRVQGMFGTLHWLWPKEFTSFWRWAETYFEVTEKVISRYGDTAKSIGGLKDGSDGEEFLRSLGPRILRRTKEEVIPWLPPKQYAEVLCYMEPAQRRQYEALTRDAEVPLNNGGSLMINGVLAQLTRSKQLANGVIETRPNPKPDEDDIVFFTGVSCKIDALMEKLEARGIVGDGGGDTKVIVSSRFNAFLEVVKARLEEKGVIYHEITGSTSDRKRDEAMEAFQQDGGARVFILNAKAGGVSITLDAADEVHCMDELDSPEDNEQLEDRVHRASRNHQVTIFYYRTAGTIDQKIAEDVEHKRFQQFKVLDGRRGQEYVRNLIAFDKEKGL